MTLFVRKECKRLQFQFDGRFGRIFWKAPLYLRFLPCSRVGVRSFFARRLITSSYARDRELKRRPSALHAYHLICTRPLRPPNNLVIDLWEKKSLSIYFKTDITVNMTCFLYAFDHFNCIYLKKKNSSFDNIKSFNFETYNTIINWQKFFPYVFNFT